MQALLEGGADPRRTSPRGDTPPHGAATPQPDRPAEDSRRIVALLVARGADANAVNAFGMAPLHQAALAGHVTLIEALVDAGARVDLGHRDGTGQTRS